MRTTLAVLPLTLLLTLGACAKKPVAGAAPASAPTVASSDDRSRREAEERARREAEEARRREELARAQAALASLVYFDYDSFDIRADSRATLQTKVPVLQSNSGVRLRIAGHTDERGSVEYNMVLGMRRAQAAKDFLTAYGLDGGRFETTSFGEARPAAPGQSEPAWSRNRRAEFEVVQGTVSVR